ncbi:MAG: hypothetical protein KF863_10855 [Rubrivivax sp.]|nr:hypothetical protein [Rubrivivax sp.]
MTLDDALHGRQRQAPLRWPADRVLQHITEDGPDPVLLAADPGPTAPTRDRVSALLTTGAARADIALHLGVSVARVGQIVATLEDK